MKALITPATSSQFHLWWDGQVVADGSSELARRAVALLNGELDLPTSHANAGGTDSHSMERGRLLTRDDFLLTVGSLVDRLPDVVRVDLVGEGAVSQSAVPTGPNHRQASPRTKAHTRRA